MVRALARHARGHWFNTNTAQFFLIMEINIKNNKTKLKFDKLHQIIALFKGFLLGYEYKSNNGEIMKIKFAYALFLLSNSLLAMYEPVIKPYSAWEKKLTGPAMKANPNLADARRADHASPRTCPERPQPRWLRQRQRLCRGNSIRNDGRWTERSHRMYLPDTLAAWTSPRSPVTGSQHIQLR